MRIPFFNPTRKRAMRNNRPFSISVCAGLLAALCLGVLADPEKDHRPIIVEAIGFGIPETGKPESEIRQEAIEDALGNAELQAYVDVDMQACIENMRTKERTMHLRSHGSAELSRILATNYVTNSTLPLYRVQVEVLVHPPSTSPPDSPVAADTDRKRPKIILIVQSTPDPKFGKSLQHTLAEHLHQSGFHLVNPPAAPGMIVMNISLVQQAGHSAIELQWKIEKRPAPGVNGSFATDRIMGTRLIPLPEQLPMELEKLGALLAHEAERVFTPRG